jgi:peptidoglycan/xylan/chitin deacetylase (PgdA/CDA1 family)
MLSSCTDTKQDNIGQLVHENLQFSAEQYKLMLSELNYSAINPRSVLEDGTTKLVKSKDWTSGFFPGNLWMLYEFSRDAFWTENADHYSLNIEQEKINGGTHDMGFKMFTSFGNGYRLTNNQQYKEILIESANTLCTRFNPTIGCIRSWDHNKDKWDFPVIIDNMLNLELLFWASRETRDSMYYNIAVSHAETTLENHFRDDNSSFHVVSFDTITGQPVKWNTHQGYSHESSWARGQAWGLYGFVMTYRETGMDKFLEQAHKIARFILNHPNLPEDKIPHWDFDVPNKDSEPRDASAAAVICSALYELSLYSNDDDKLYYQNQADEILSSLSSPGYRATLGENNFFLLKHSTGDYPKDSEIDVPIIYADYYFIEANMRRLKILGDWEGKKAAVINKVDDVVYDETSSVPEKWERFAQLAIEKNVKVAPGIIGNSLDEGDDAYFDWIREMNETGLFEFWNHGYLHKRWEENSERYSEFFNTDVEQQMQYIRQTQDLGREKLDIDFTTFGAPYNWTDENTNLALQQFPNLKVWFYPGNDFQNEMIMLQRIPALNIEYPVHLPNFYHFFNSYYFYSKKDVITIQGHPRSWDDHGFNQFEHIIDYLKSIDAPIILPSDLL